jgi:Regulator of chromosome condensation (RCC1) repeat
MNRLAQRFRFLIPWLLWPFMLASCGGDGDQKLTPLERQIYLEPTPISTTLTFDRVAQGYDSSCMLTPTGDAWCWGNNEHGQLGAPTAKSCQGGFVACTWQPVHAQPPTRFAQLSPSRLHSWRYRHLRPGLVLGVRCRRSAWRWAGHRQRDTCGHCRQPPLCSCRCRKRRASQLCAGRRWNRVVLGAGRQRRPGQRHDRRV